jgi:hydrogenase nickel incorporation protein HypA/HybF
MHELAIAESIVRIASEHAAGRPVAAVEVRVGHLRQVVPSALSFSFDLVAEGTPAEGAELVILEVEAIGRCRVCDAESRLERFPLVCRSCGSFDVDVVRGDELYVESLELEEAVAANA